MTLPAVTREKLQELFDYDRVTGRFIQKKARQNIRVGEVAGSLDVLGYRYIRIANKKYLEHRLVWLYATGIWPKHEIDHINCNRSDNRIENLRDVPATTNQHNRVRPQSNNTLGVLGVKRSGRKYIAHIRTNGVRKYLGTYETVAAASAAYLAEKAVIHNDGYTTEEVK